MRALKSPVKEFDIANSLSTPVSLDTRPPSDQPRSDYVHVETVSPKNQWVRLPVVAVSTAHICRLTCPSLLSIITIFSSQRQCCRPAVFGRSHMTHAIEKPVLRAAFGYLIILLPLRTRIPSLRTAMQAMTESLHGIDGSSLYRSIHQSI